MSHLPPLKTPLPQLKSPGREIELKFLATESVLKAAQKWDTLGGHSPRARRLRSVYFDTAERDLERHQAVLRVRSLNRRRLLTFKWAGTSGPFERGEVEVATTSETPDAALFGPEIAGLIATLTQSRPLSPVYATEVKRTTHRIPSASGEIELAFDTGQIIAGETTEKLCEIELELKSGDPAELYEVGISLANTFPLRLGIATKGERGARLVSGERPEIIRATAALAGEPTVDEAIGLVLNSCLSHFTANWPAFEDGDGPKAVHQMRVAMRRLRSIIGLFQGAFPNPQFAAFRLQARDLANAMGEARNWDVFIDLLHGGPVPAFPREPGFEKLLDRANTFRTAGYTAIHNLLAAQETTRFILTLQSFIARHGWRNALGGEILPSLTLPAHDFAFANIARLHHRMLKRSKKFDDLAPHARHEVRKDLKKLRYATELFSTLFEKRGKIETYIRTISKLQDQLGIFNDLITAQDLAARLNPGNDLDTARATGIIMGWCARGATIDDDAMDKAWKKFRAVKLFS